MYFLTAGVQWWWPEHWAWGLGYQRNKKSWSTSVQISCAGWDQICSFFGTLIYWKSLLLMCCMIFLNLLKQDKRSTILCKSGHFLLECSLVGPFGVQVKTGSPLLLISSVRIIACVCTNLHARPLFIIYITSWVWTFSLQRTSLTFDQFVTKLLQLHGKVRD